MTYINIMLKNFKDDYIDNYPKILYHNGGKEFKVHNLQSLIENEN